MTYEYSSYLEHHGVKGQKWGVRRYQNEDGSLTAEGRKRYSSALEEGNKLIEPGLKELDKMVGDVRKKGLDSKYVNGYELANAYGPKKASEMLQKSMDEVERQIKETRKDVEYNKRMSAFMKSNERVTLKDLQKEGERVGKEVGFKKGEAKKKEKKVWEYTVYGGGEG